MGKNDFSGEEDIPTTREGISKAGAMSRAAVARSASLVGPSSCRQLCSIVCCSQDTFEVGPASLRQSSQQVDTRTRACSEEYSGPLKSHSLPYSKGKK
mmetsp:Transcript_3430/g.5145  ORF Transcript_3430/g.5145 Transcript_3430/m.5145 type:complete len:98 (+) Transcript_3430:289-582(+)